MWESFCEAHIILFRNQYSTSLNARVAEFLELTALTWNSLYTHTVTLHPFTGYYGRIQARYLAGLGEGNLIRTIIPYKDIHIHGRYVEGILIEEGLAWLTGNIVEHPLNIPGMPGITRRYRPCVSGYHLQTQLLRVSIVI